jgi:hypothetical protein
MPVREFISQLQEALDRAVARRRGSKEVIIVFQAPSSGFCGPTIRPKYLGKAHGEGGELLNNGGRYGLTRSHVERLLEAFNVTLPPEFP